MSKSNHQSNQSNYVGLALTVCLVVIVIAGAVLFIQSSQQSDSNDTSGSSGSKDTIGSGGGGTHGGNGPSSRAGGKQGIGSRMVVGEVTAADESSITVKTSDGTSRTFTVTSATEVLPGTNQATQSYDPDNIEIGSTVAIGPNSSNDDQADAIALNYETRTNEE
jgi:preprotein translocase subunit YajC